MKINILIVKTITLALISTTMLTSCNREANFDPPNKEKITTGTAEKVVPVGTAMTMIKYSDKIAKIWSKEALLVGISGSRLDEQGSNVANFDGSQWIMTYFSPAKDNLTNTYTITLNGKGNVSWLESGYNYTVNNSIANLSVDSGKALSAAFNSGLPKSDAYIAEISKNNKGMIWSVGFRINNGSGYEIRKVDAITGSIIN